MKKTGFSLIELLVVLAILGILIAIALPLYSQYIILANRSAAKAFLMEVVSREEVYLGQVGTYTDTLANLGITVLPPELESAGYDVAITLQTLTLQAGAPAVTMLGYSVTATPAAGSRQEADGALSVNQFGLKTPVQKW